MQAWRRSSGVLGKGRRYSRTGVVAENEKIAGKPIEKGHDGASGVTGAPKTSQAAGSDAIGEEMRADTFVVEDTEVDKGYKDGSWMGATKTAVRDVVDKIKRATGM